MKKSILLTIPLILTLMSCAEDNNSPTNDSNTTPIITDTSNDESTITDTSIKVDIDDQDDKATPTKINRVIKAPDFIFKDSKINPKDFLIEVLLSDGTIRSIDPDFVEANFEGKNDGDDIEVTIHFINLTFSYTLKLKEYKKDIINVDISNKSSTYGSWSYTSGNTNAIYNGYTAASSNALKLSSSAVAGRPGILSSVSCGTIKKVTINWNSGTTDGRIVGLYAKNTPFFNEEDLSDLSSDMFVHNFTYNSASETLSETFEISGDYYYFAIISNGLLYLDSIEINWNSYVAVPSLKSLSVSGYLSATTLDKTYDSSNLTINGLFSNDLEADMTRFCDISYLTNIPSEPVEDFDVELKVTYTRDTSITYLSKVKANIIQGYPFAVNWSFDEVKTGGYLSCLFMKKDSSGFYVTNISTAGTNTYLQILDTNTYWEEAPKKINVVATIGASTALRDLDEDHSVYVSLLDKDGNEIEGSKKLLSSSIEKDPNEYSFTYDETFANVAGIRLSQKKVSRKNLRIYGLSMTYEA